MSHRLLPLRKVFALASASLLLCASGWSASRPPNVVFILADDLGSSEIGCYGQKKIRTPRIDHLAGEGMRFTQHYSGNAVCAPSRCVLMTGKHPGHAWVRNNRETPPEGQFPLPEGAVTLARLLKEQGYRTGAFGKWGLGGPDSPGRPLNQGFDRFYGYNCQAKAHNYYPESLWDNDKVVKLDNPTIPRNAPLPEGADPATSASYQGFTGKEYSADLIAEQARRFVRENKDVPFFLFVPTTVPHLALQVPEDSVAEYRGLWPDPPYTGGHGYLPNLNPRATYAAMITRLDREVGRLLDLLDELKLADDTIVVFTSDNGPTHDHIGGSDSDFFESAGKLRGVKGSLYDGGVRVPLIVRWKGHVGAGSVCERVTGFEDWIPTLLELVGSGKATPSGMDGISFAPSLLGQKQPEREFLYREFPAYGGQQSVRVGDWKAIRQNLVRKKKGPKLEPTFELYNLKTDPSESRDVAAENPEVVARLQKIMAELHTPSEHFRLGIVDAGTSRSDSAESGE